MIRFYTEDKKTLEKIEDTVRQELGLKYIILCNKIELYFYHHRNENVRIKDLAGIYNEFRRTIHLKVQDPKDFVYDVSKIVDILTKYRYIEEIEASQADPYNRVCIRTKEYNLVGL